LLLTHRWKSLADPDALGEYTGVKPDEFLTLDKHTMEQSGQIMYDTMAKGNSCSTIDRLERKGSPSQSYLIAGYRHQGPTDYNTGMVWFHHASSGYNTI